MRSPAPRTPKERPAYQGSNRKFSLCLFVTCPAISDFWSLKSLEMTSKYIVRAYKDSGDEEARSQMLLASTYAGVGFGNAGVHLCVSASLHFFAATCISDLISTGCHILLPAMHTS